MSHDSSPSKTVSVHTWPRAARTRADAHPGGGETQARLRGRRLEGIAGTRIAARREKEGKQVTDAVRVYLRSLDALCYEVSAKPALLPTFLRIVRIVPATIA